MKVWVLMELSGGEGYDPEVKCRGVFVSEDQARREAESAVRSDLMAYIDGWESRARESFPGGREAGLKRDWELGNRVFVLRGHSFVMVLSPQEVDA